MYCWGMRHLGAAEHKHKLLDKALGKGAADAGYQTGTSVRHLGLDLAANRFRYGARKCAAQLYGIREEELQLCLRCVSSWPEDRSTGMCAIKAAINRVMDFNIEFHRHMTMAKSRRMGEAAGPMDAPRGWFQAELLHRSVNTHLKIIRRQADQ